MHDLVLWQKQEYTGMKPGLGRIRAFLKATGDPQEAFDAVHIAGTNGKGSTARMLSLILEKAGYRTGLYVSPHLVRINERIQIDSKSVSDRELDFLARKYGKTARKCGLTFFEFMTGLAFHHFARQGVQVAVLETGLGGRYDATNVVKKPKICIITDIDYDHQQFLGKRLADIAGEKAGIIKRGCPVISGVERPEAARIIRREAKKVSSCINELHRDFEFCSGSIAWNKGFQEFAYRGLSDAVKVRLPLLGCHQNKNCSLALAAVEILNDRGLAIRMSAAIAALRGVAWPGRFDIRRVRYNGRKRVFILDGAHNPGAMKRFADSWDKSPFSEKKMTLVFGVLKDKDHRAVIKELASRVGRVILVPVRSPRALEMDAMIGEWERYISRESIATSDSFSNALQKLGNERAVAVTGSLYLVGEAVRYFEGQQRS